MEREKQGRKQQRSNSGPHTPSREGEGLSPGRRKVPHLTEDEILGRAKPAKKERKSLPNTSCAPAPTQGAAALQYNGVSEHKSIEKPPKRSSVPEPAVVARSSTQDKARGPPAVSVSKNERKCRDLLSTLEKVPEALSS
ncbi:hypothetical protein TRAPUB_13669 [Trametes pubescens]|uniref:Uncharacterized protein n=1 Tax=Trametes pubescens TaxID=154538 RepID=A0A1M2VQI8_TRAPU|nr:hypothetical protein TRAPUB_13669 [Trametes pubescens]